MTSCGEFVVSRILDETVPVARALLRRYRSDGWYNDAGVVAPNAITAVLMDCGFRVFDHWSKSQRNVADWAAETARTFPGEDVIVYIGPHVFIARDGYVFDEEFTNGIQANEAPYWHEPVELLSRVRGQDEPDPDRQIEFA